jgi:hypothetical protein
LIGHGTHNNSVGSRKIPDIVLLLPIISALSPVYR